MPISRVDVFFSAGSACSQRTALYCLHDSVLDAFALAGASVVLFSLFCFELADFCTEGPSKTFGGCLSSEDTFSKEAIAGSSVSRQALSGGSVSGQTAAVHQWHPLLLLAGTFTF